MREAKAADIGSLERGEGMPISQMHSLDAIYNKLSRLGNNVLIKNIDQGETLCRLAFKEQAQCRANIEALAEMKNPRSVAFVKQANIAAGNQQVNNGDDATLRARARTRENAIPPNKLLTDTNYETLDDGSARTTSGANSTMDTVGALNGAADKAG